MSDYWEKGQMAIVRVRKERRLLGKIGQMAMRVRNEVSLQRKSSEIDIVRVYKDFTLLGKIGEKPIVRVRKDVMVLDENKEML